MSRPDSQVKIYTARLDHCPRHKQTISPCTKTHAWGARGIISIHTDHTFTFGGSQDILRRPR